MKVTAHLGDRSLDRESVTSGHTEVPLKVYRTTDPPLFAGLRERWVDGKDPETGTTFEVSAGAGFGSPYATLSVKVPGHPIVYEYIDITELLTNRVEAIIAERAGNGGNDL